ncbi:MAG: polysaccharide biosynthesis C-terminal domain-containing protein [Clostridia bacterium]|nr:polysaccharide biosynthesis C-terminal domain-containing protein [Clostridia bacterium]
MTKPQTKPQENIMGTMPEGKLLFTMAFPMVISMLVQALYNVYDSLVVAGYDSAGVTALSLAFPIQNLMIAFATGTGVGINSYLSRALGERRPDKANKAATNGLFVILLTNILFIVLGLLGTRAYFTYLTDAVPGTPAFNMGVEYLSVVTIASSGIFFEVTFERLLQATGKAKLSMFTQGLGAIVNIILDPIFILSAGDKIFGITLPFGLGMGAMGAAIATVLGQFAAAGLGLFLNLKYNKEISLSFKGFKPDLDIIKKIYTVGLPSIFMAAVGSFLTMAINKILTIGEQVTYMNEGMSAATAAKLAAERLVGVSIYGVYFRLQSFVFMPIFGMNNGMIPIIAYNYGMRSKKRIMKTVKIAVCAAVIYMLIGLAVFQTMSGTLLKVFYQEDAQAESETTITVPGSSEGEESEEVFEDAMITETQAVLKYGEPAMRIISLCFLFAGVCIITISCLQALGRGTPSLIISLIRQIVVILPLSFIFAKTLGLIAIFAAYPIAEFVALIISILMFVRTYKKLLVPLDEPIEDQAPAHS